MSGGEARNDRGRLRVHLLGSLDFDAALRLQRALVYQFSGRAPGAALILCEHPPLITVGRHGSPGHIRAGRDELASRGWPVRWVSRGGGTVLHVPGQLAVYPVLPLAPLGLDVRGYLRSLQQVLVAVVDDFGILATTRPDEAGVWVGPRLIAAVGVAVRQQVTTFGACLNIDPDLTLFRLVQCGTRDDGPMTSLARERRGPLRPALVRQRLVEHFRDEFGFDQADVLFQAPAEPGHVRLAARS
jgi:lipoyl(octanoyl) transferase